MTEVPNQLTDDIAKSNGVNFNDSINQAFSDGSIGEQELKALSIAYKEHMTEIINISEKNLQLLKEKLGVTKGGLKEVFIALNKKSDYNPVGKDVIGKLRDFKDKKFNKNEKTPEKSTEAIFAIQSVLVELGYKPGAIDGQFKNGGKTQDALKEFQKKYNSVKGNVNIGSNGFPGPKTIKALIKSYNDFLVKRQEKLEEDTIPVQKVARNDSEVAPKIESVISVPESEQVNIDEKQDLILAQKVTKEPVSVTGQETATNPPVEKLVISEEIKIKLQNYIGDYKINGNNISLENIEADSKHKLVYVIKEDNKKITVDLSHKGFEHIFVEENIGGIIVNYKEQVKNFSIPKYDTDTANKLYGILNDTGIKININESGEISLSHANNISSIWKIEKGEEVKFSDGKVSIYSNIDKKGYILSKNDGGYILGSEKFKVSYKSLDEDTNQNNVEERIGLIKSEFGEDKYGLFIGSNYLLKVKDGKLISKTIDGNNTVDAFSPQSGKWVKYNDSNVIQATAPVVEQIAPASVKETVTTQNLELLKLQAKDLGITVEEQKLSSGNTQYKLSFNNVGDIYLSKTVIDKDLQGTLKEYIEIGKRIKQSKETIGKNLNDNIAFLRSYGIDISGKTGIKPNNTITLANINSDEYTASDKDLGANLDYINNNIIFSNLKFEKIDNNKFKIIANQIDVKTGEGKPIETVSVEITRKVEYKSPTAELKKISKKYNGLTIVDISQEEYNKSVLEKGKATFELQYKGDTNLVNIGLNQIGDLENFLEKIIPSYIKSVDKKVTNEKQKDDQLGKEMDKILDDVKKKYGLKSIYIKSEGMNRSPGTDVLNLSSMIEVSYTDILNTMSKDGIIFDSGYSKGQLLSSNLSIYIKAENSKVYKVGKSLKLHLANLDQFKKQFDNALNQHTVQNVGNPENNNTSKGQVAKEVSTAKDYINIIKELNIPKDKISQLYEENLNPRSESVKKDEYYKITSINEASYPNLYNQYVSTFVEVKSMKDKTIKNTSKDIQGTGGTGKKLNEKDW